MILLKEHVHPLCSWVIEHISICWGSITNGVVYFNTEMRNWCTE